jgi:hypothetical protein
MDTACRDRQRQEEESTGMTLPTDRSAGAAPDLRRRGDDLRRLGAGTPRAPRRWRTVGALTVTWLHQRVRELAAGAFGPIKVDCRRR